MDTQEYFIEPMSSSFYNQRMRDIATSAQIEFYEFGLAVEKVGRMPWSSDYDTPVKEDTMKNRATLHRKAVERRKKAKRGGKR